MYLQRKRRCRVTSTTSERSKCEPRRVRRSTALPEFALDRVAPLEQLRRVMGEWVGEVTSSSNLVVVRTPPGCAHVVASALDRSAVHGLIGTVAGDDTVICIAAENSTGQRLAAHLRELAGIDGGVNYG